MEVNHANKLIKLYMNCGIIAVVMGIILSIIGNFFEHCSKVLAMFIYVCICVYVFSVWVYNNHLLGQLGAYFNSSDN